MATAIKKPYTHEERVELYVKIITLKLGAAGLTDFNVAYMRNAAPSKVEADALNDALLKLGWQR